MIVVEGNKLNGEKVTEERLLENGYRKYSGSEIDIYYNQSVCEHAGYCVRGNANVYEVGRRPWVIPDNGSLEDNIDVINTCPSGALKYIAKKS